MSKKKIQEDFEQQIGELTLDLQRTRADFENYRKRVDEEKTQARRNGEMSAIVKLLPIIDTIERAVVHVPEELKDNSWAKGVESLEKNLAKLLKDINVEKIEITPGETEFDPNLHDAISADDSDGDKEVVSEELQPGYLLNGEPLRHSMVRVTRK